MKDVLYIGPYRQNDEWGYTAKGFLQMLGKEQNINLVSRPVWFNQDFVSFDIENIVKYESNVLNGTLDILIQHGLPQYLNYNGSFKKNIAVLRNDICIDNTNWIDHLKLFDEVLVFSEFEKQQLIKSGLTNVISFDFPPFMFSSIPPANINIELTEKIFYTVGSSQPKDALKEIIIAFLSEFSKNENVVLIIMTNEHKQIEEIIDNTKKDLGMYYQHNYYPNIAIVGSDNQAVIDYVHNKGHSFIDVKYNQIISQNLLKAFLFHKIPIILDTNKSLIEGYDFVVESSEEICLNKFRPLPMLYVNQSWNVPKIYSIKENLRKAYKIISKETLDINDYQLNMKFNTSIFTKNKEKIQDVLN